MTDTRLLDTPDEALGTSSAHRRRLIFRLDVFEDESLLGFAARAARPSEVTQMTDVLALAGIITAKPVTAPRMFASSAGDLAKVLRLDETEVVRRMYRDVEASSPVRLMDFFGVNIPACHREPRVRRVSPLALTHKSYHRAAWELRPLTFDGPTMQLLISQCEACLQTFGWRRSHEAHRCEHCGADIRAMSASSVAFEDRVPCSFAAGLVDPIPRVRAQTRAMVPAPLLTLDDGELFDLCVRLATIDRARTVWRGGAALAQELASTTWNSALLAKGARIVLGWPESLYRICDRLRAEAYQRMGAYGVSKELGPLQAFAASKCVPGPLRNLIAAEIAAYYNSLTTVIYRGPDKRSHGEHQGLVTIQAAAEICETRPAVIRRVLNFPEARTLRVQNTERSPVFLDKQQILAWNEIRKSLIDVHDAQATTGLPEYALLDLAQRGDISRETGPASVMAGKRFAIWFIRASIEALIERTMTLAEPLHSTRGMLPLTTVLRNSRQVGTWVSVLEAIFGGRLHVHLMQDEPSTAVFCRLYAAPEQVESLLAASKIRPLAGCETDLTMSAVAAADYLNTAETVVVHLVHARGGIEGLGPRGRKRPVRSSVAAFARDYMLGGEVCQALPLTRRQCTSALARHGIHPAFRIYGDRPIWRRKDIEALLRLR
jgi:hypothetical protein